MQIAKNTESPSLEPLSSLATGPTEADLSPANKYWIIIQLGFTPVGRYKWMHPVLLLNTGEPVYFDINTEPLLMLTSRVFKAGYKNQPKSS